MPAMVDLRLLAALVLLLFALLEEMAQPILAVAVLGVEVMSVFAVVMVVDRADSFKQL
jgi:hypothetical protein